MSSFENVRAVIFDAVGTLIEADPPVVSVYHSAGARHGSSLSTDDVSAGLATAIEEHFCGAHSSEELERERWSRVVADVFHDIPDTSSLFAELWQHFAEARHWRVAEGVDRLWQQLEAHGYTVAIASNFDARLLDISEHLPPLNRASSIFVSSQLGYSKPHPNFFRAVERSLRLTPHQLLMIGDNRINDYDGARQAGWNAVLISSRETGDEYSIATLEAVSRFLGI